MGDGLWVTGEMKGDITQYISWLMEEKGIGGKAAHDYASRLKRF